MLLTKQSNDIFHGQALLNKQTDKMAELNWTINVPEYAVVIKSTTQQGALCQSLDHARKHPSTDGKPAPRGTKATLYAKMMGSCRKT
jgi:hypothetical protein